MFLRCNRPLQLGQQVHIPHMISDMLDPCISKLPGDVRYIGVCCEGSEKQVFYLGDEGVAPGKVANTVVSFLHHYLENYGLGEAHAQFHFDNCQGQNKNNAVLGNAVWRTLTGGHKTIQYSLMLADTKIVCDWHFGFWKNRWRHMDAETVEEVAFTVAMSSRNGHSIPHIVDGNSKPVSFFHWSTFFKGIFKPLKNILIYHSFEVSSNEPGIVRVRKFVDAPEEKINILKTCQVDIGVLPEQIFGEGICAERQWYLHDVIRDFCRSDNAKNTTCPLPLVAKEGYSKAKKLKLRTLSLCVSAKSCSLFLATNRLACICASFMFSFTFKKNLSLCYNDKIFMILGMHGFHGNQKKHT